MGYVPTPQLTPPGFGTRVRIWPAPQSGNAKRASGVDGSTPGSENRSGRRSMVGGEDGGEGS